MRALSTSGAPMGHPLLHVSLLVQPRPRVRLGVRSQAVTDHTSCSVSVPAYWWEMAAGCSQVSDVCLLGMDQ
jgi:hypothetical protein